MAIPAGAEDITTPQALSEVARALAHVKELAVDVEADAMHHFRARLCFVQLGTDTDIFLVDTLAPDVRPDALSAMFADATVTKFFHAAQGDLQYLAEAGVRVKGLFDTHRAATLLGWPKVGLADLVKEHLGATLQKEHQQADFSLRPLPPELRAYIADDVRYLVDVGRKVRDACLAADILEEVVLDCDRLCEEAAARPDPLQTLNIKLPRQGLSAEQVRLAQHLARELNRLRLQWAEAEDVPMGRMLSNMAIASIATKPPASLRELAKLQGVRGGFVRQHGDAVLATIEALKQRAHGGGLEDLDKKERKDPRAKKREDVLLDWRKAAAAERKVTPSVVLPNALVEMIAEAAPKTLDELRQIPFFGEKRALRHGESLLAALKPYV
ncbi:MAG: HRDC domain-containing protein [Myxococcota bacterium]